MDEQPHYSEALRDAVEGHTLLVQHACGEPRGLLRFLASGKYRRPPRIVSGFSFSLADVLREYPDSEVRFATWQPYGDLTEPVRRGQLELLPWRYSDIPDELFRSAWAPDAALLQVSPPDTDGRCCIGPVVSVVMLIAERVAEIWGLVNAAVPRIPGDGWLEARRLRRQWPLEAAMLAYPAANDEALSDAELAIAGHLAPYVPRQAVLQVGLGAIPTAVYRALAGSGAEPFSLLTEAGRALLEAPGAPPLARVCEVMGRPELLEWAASSGRVRLLTSAFIHAAEPLRDIERLIAVNSAVEVDLTGQVDAESIGARQISGPGGQLDFMQAAHASPTGLSVIALPATAAGGRVSRIVAALRPGAVVTTPRGAVDLVITEHGVADLRGATIRERQQRLLAIAAPEHRERIYQALTELEA